MIRCSNCGNENPDFANFCELCGKNLEREKAAGPAASPGAGAFRAEAAGPARAFLRSGSTGKEYMLFASGEALIGRGDPAKGIRPEVELNDNVARAKGVSRLHAKVFFAEGGFHLMDLNSTNSTFINGNRLPPHQPQGLRDGDEVRLGDYEMTFHLLG